MTNGNGTNFSQTGGARIDSWNCSAPYAVLTAFRDALRLSCKDEYVFPKSKIVALTRHRGLFSVGLRITHDVPLYPSFIVFWVSVVPGKKRFALLKARLAALGYEVED
jgi:hypothetical protein